MEKNTKILLVVALGAAAGYFLLKKKPATAAATGKRGFVNAGDCGKAQLADKCTKGNTGTCKVSGVTYYKCCQAGWVSTETGAGSCSVTA